MGHPPEQLFDQNPAVALPLGIRGPEGMIPTIAGRICQLNQRLAALSGRDAAPYITDTDRLLRERSKTPWPYPGKVLRLDTEDAVESRVYDNISAMAPGSMSILLRFANNGASLPMFGVKLPNPDEDAASVFAIAAIAQNERGHSAKSLSEARRVVVPPHLQPTPTREPNGAFELNPDANIFDNTRLVLGDAYHRAASLLGAPPPQARGGHSAVDGTHNPGIHRIIVAGNTDQVVRDPGALLHDLHELRQLTSDGRGTMAALQEYFHKLNIDRPMAPISVVRLGRDDLANTGIWLPSALLDPKTHAPLTIAALAPTLSVIGTYAMLPGNVRKRADLGSPDQGLKALEKGANVNDIGNLL